MAKINNYILVCGGTGCRASRSEEIIAALDLGRSTYYEQRDDGRLLCADNLLRLAAELDLNPVELLMHCGLVEAPAVIDCAGKVGDTTGSTPPRSRRFRRRPDAPPL